MTTWVRRALVLSGLWMVVTLPIATGAEPQPEYPETKESTLDLEPMENQSETGSCSIPLRTPTIRKIALSFFRKSSEKESATFSARSSCLTS